MEKEPFRFKDSLLFIDSWNKIDRNIVVGMTTRQGGFSKAPFNSMNLGLHVYDSPEDVIQNREQLAKQLNIPLASSVYAEQVHGANITRVTKAERGKGATELETAIKGVDGLYTGDDSTFLFAAYADCVPLYFYAPKHHLVGIAHAGWRGTVNNIAGEMIKAWTNKENVRADEILVSIGPAIGECCYIVDNNVIEQLDKALDYKMLDDVYSKLKGGQYRLNLKQANFLLLINAGVSANNIEISTYCTCCHHNLFFSHRRDNGKTGRMLSFIGMKGE
ncbi:peptidoglycan editing factor PgeF [Calidifontibacillus oryziterrae]|uniref:peptidoglycan editing factor PgeF n=1 Tax=Calidifontibacillus oryziterrae TaxID=1191699 RepID=UPI00031A095B|nr:peptidoglycan editing factor PgeF [Calidifontibacillus oryziterrae]